MNKLPIILGLAFLFCLAAKPAPASDTLSLAGQWRFALDRNDAGIAGDWFDQVLPDRIRLPGSLPGQGIGDPITTNTVWVGGIVDRSWFTAPEFEAYRQPGNVKVPFWLQPETYYAGVAWFQREIRIPNHWSGRHIVLSLERPHWETRVWVDGKIVGTNDSLSTPHEYDLGQLAPGQHTLTLRVDNRVIVDIGENSHSISDHTQGNWNGIVGDLSLRATPLVWIDDLQVYPRVASRIRAGEGNDRQSYRRGRPWPNPFLTRRKRGGDDRCQLVGRRAEVFPAKSRWAKRRRYGMSFIRRSSTLRRVSEIVPAA